MRTEYQRDVHNNYMVLHLDSPVDETSYHVRMLLANTIPFFLPCRLQNMNGKRLFYYEITSKQSLSGMYEGKKLGYEDLKQIFGSFVELIEKMAEYLLNPDHLVLNPAQVYLDVGRKNLYFCYLPGYEKTIREQFQSLTEYILPKLDHEDERAVILGYGIYRRALEDVFQLEHIKEEVYKELPVKPTQEKYPDFSIKEPIPMEKSVAYNKENDVLGEMEQFTIRKKNENKNPKKQKSKGKSDKETGKKSQQISVLDILLMAVSCILAAVILFLIIIAKRYGLVPTPELEMILGFILGVLFLMGLGRFVVRKIKSHKHVSKIRQSKPKPGQMKEKNTGNDAYEITQNEVCKEYSPEISELSNTPQEERKVLEFVEEDEEENYGETTILSQEPVKGPASLVSREPGELATIYLQKDLMIIGKMANAADAVIPMPTVSRLHAKIRRIGEEYYVTDLNSKNGTAVNGRMLKADEDYQLQDEDEIDFAQARYVFLK